MDGLSVVATAPECLANHRRSVALPQRHHDSLLQVYGLLASGRGGVPYRERHARGSGATATRLNEKAAPTGAASKERRAAALSTIPVASPAVTGSQ
jgi:hypothetical protein